MKRLVLVICLLATPALAQQAPPDPIFMQKAIAALQAQRNAALDAGAAAEAKAGQLAEENAALKKQIGDLAKKPAEPAPQP